MPVTPSFLRFVLEQLGVVQRDIITKRMFGGVGIYAGDTFFALIDDDVLYFKVDERTRGRYVEAGMGPFRPYGDDGGSMKYFQVPIGVLEDTDELTDWVREAIGVALGSVRRPKGPGAPRKRRGTSRTRA